MHSMHSIPFLYSSSMCKSFGFEELQRVAGAIPIAAQSRSQISESERVLCFCGNPGVSRPQTQATTIILFPSLAEDEEHIIAGPHNPANATLPAEVSGFIVELDQIEQR